MSPEKMQVYMWDVQKLFEDAKQVGKMLLLMFISDHIFVKGEKKVYKQITYTQLIDPTFGM